MGKREDGGEQSADSLEAGGGAVRVLRKGRTAYRDKPTRQLLKSR